MAASQLRSVTATSSYVALPDIPAVRVSILNQTGATLSIDMVGDSGANKEIVLANSLSVGISVVANADEIRIKSTTGGTTGVYVVIDN
jgi:hypothetical protein